jgi:H+/Cl- antiporter ClcA
VTHTVVAPRRALITGSLIAAAIAATALNAVVAALAHAAGASSTFQALQLPTYAVFTVLGVLAGAAGWALVRARTRSPRRVLRVLAPAVVLLSFIPDVLVGASGGLPGTSWGGVVALMVMHLVVTAVAVTTYLRVLPLSADRS